MQGEIRINLVQLARSYGFKPEQFLTFYLDLADEVLKITPLEPEIQRDLDAIKAIGQEMYE